MAQDWALVDDVFGGTRALREKKQTYLPKFKSESQDDWSARNEMTFVPPTYAETIEERVGMVFTAQPEFDEDVPKVIREQCEDVDGEGTHWHIFAQRAFESAYHLGHGVLFVDYPDIPKGEENLKLKDVQEESIRPYWRWIKASDVLAWRETKIGGVRKVTMISWVEYREEDEGDFGSCDVPYIRVIRQEVIRTKATRGIKASTKLGPITWELYKVDTKDDGGKKTPEPTLEESGTIRGPKEIPISLIYGGRKAATLVSRPALVDLAWQIIEEWQVRSDYASVMHKSNVPTPVFKGRPAADRKKPVTMGAAVDLPDSGTADAFFLEPSGAAIGATRDRLRDIQEREQRMGAASVEKAQPMTAREAGIVARRRNAQLVLGARSLQDGLETALKWHAQYIDEADDNGDGGSIVFKLDFSDAGLDVNFARLCWEMYKENALPYDALVAVLQTGKLPDEFKAEEAMIRLLAAEEAYQAAVAEQNRQYGTPDPNAQNGQQPGTPAAPPRRQKIKNSGEGVPSGAGNGDAPAQGE